MKAVESFFSAEDVFLLVNADIYTSYSLKELLSPLKSNKKILGNLAVMDRIDSTYLDFNSEGSFCGWLKATDQTEPSSVAGTKKGNSVHAFCGLQALSTRIFDYLKKESKSSFSIIETYMNASRTAEQILFSDIGSEPWFDMGTPEQLERLRSHLRS